MRHWLDRRRRSWFRAALESWWGTVFILTCGAVAMILVYCAGAGCVASERRANVATSQPVTVEQGWVKAVIEGIAARLSVKGAGSDAASSVGGSVGRDVRITQGGGQVAAWGGWLRTMLTAAGAFAAGWVLPSCWPLKRKKERWRHRSITPTPPP